MPYADPVKRSEYAKEWQAKFGLKNHRSRRLKHRLILDRIKLEEGCQHCGYDSYAVGLEFHHINPSDKSFNLSKISMRLINLLRETEKCIVLCSTCHRVEEQRLNPDALY